MHYSRFTAVSREVPNFEDHFKQKEQVVINNSYVTAYTICTTFWLIISLLSFATWHLFQLSLWRCWMTQQGVFKITMSISDSNPLPFLLQSFLLKTTNAFSTFQLHLFKKIRSAQITWPHFPQMLLYLKGKMTLITLCL